MKKTNEKGFTFEVDESLTKYAQEDDLRNENKGLSKKIIVLKISKDNIVYGYFLFDTETQTPLTEEMGVEAIACKIDSLKFLNNFKK